MKTQIVFILNDFQMLQVIALLVIAAVLRNPELIMEQNSGRAPVLPTPLSEVEHDFDSRRVEVFLKPQSDVWKQNDFNAAHGYREFFGHRSINPRKSIL